MNKLLYQDLTHTIIGVYYDVYNGTSHTYPEYIYERAMIHDLQQKDVMCQRQPEYRITYKDMPVGLQILDLFVAGEVVVELKATPELTRQHKAQALSYLKVVDKQIGLLCNFGSSKPEFERLYFHRRTPQNPLQLPREWPNEFLTPELTHLVIGGLYEVHNTLGPGFVYRIYANAVFQELHLRGLEIIPRQVYEVWYRGESIGAIKFRHLQIGNDLMVFPVAIQNLEDVSINNLKAWMSIQKIPLGILVNFYPASLEFKVLRI